MIHAYLSGLAFAVLISLPPGPLVLLTLNRARDGFRVALPFVCAVTVSDSLYAALAGTGVLATLAAGGEHWLRVAAVPLLIATAWLLWPHTENANRNARHADLLVPLLSPPSILLWLSVAASLTALPSAADLGCFVAGAGCGTFSVFTPLALAGSRASMLISEQLARRVARLFTLLVLLLAAWTATQLLAG